MKFVSIAGAAVIAPLLFILGCGNGSGGSDTSAAKSFSGIWSGTTTSTAGSRKGTVNKLTVLINQSGANATGVDISDSSGYIVTGTSTGTVTGSTAMINVDYGTKVGTATVNFMQNGNTLSGTYSQSLNGVVVDSGNVSLTKSSITTTANIAGTYAGTSTKTGGSPTSLAFSVLQTGNTFSITSMGAVGSTAFTGTGVIIGNTFGINITDTGSTNVIDLYGTASGNMLSGTTWEPGTNSGNNGTAVTGVFSVTAPAPV